MSELTITQIFEQLADINATASYIDSFGIELAFDMDIGQPIVYATLGGELLEECDTVEAALAICMREAENSADQED